MVSFASASLAAQVSVVGWAQGTGCMMLILASHVALCADERQNKKLLRIPPWEKGTQAEETQNDIEVRRPEQLS